MKVLFVHYSDYLEIGIPGGISILSAVVKEHGHDTRLFDTTFLKPDYYRRSLRGGPAVFKKTAYTLEDLVENDPVVCIDQEFARVLQEYQPDLLAVSAMTTNFDETVEMLRRAELRCPVVVGGVHSTLRPDEVLREPVIEFVCVGEGEGALVDLCDALEDDRDTTKIPNLWSKAHGEVIKTPYRPFEDLNRLPLSDWSIFDERHLFRPFEGKVYRGSFVTTSRGCPMGCTYCVNKVLRGTFRECGSYFRHQGYAKTVEDIRLLKERHGATWFKFADDTFLLHSIEDLTALRDGLQDLSIMFGCSVQPSTIRKEKVVLARDMGCVAMSVGIESGNEELRRKILNRKISNRDLEKGIRIILEAGIRVSTFNMIGLPGETRENVFETIRFNKKLGIKAANVYVLYPFPGTAIANTYGTNYRDVAGKMIPMTEGARFNLSRMSREEVEGLLKTFNLYLVLPEAYWGRIQDAEGWGERAQRVFSELEELAATYV